ncbi:MAG: hypothetical protein A2234_09605 [Elusimicrobia bacterium RIFOXYA2_FULL_58_8]|nr:MAG: hypothetical protein A2285_06890 [Elusimicrobia bacterium RIFOXYA12_FULL_57_11]OGS14048.1 MAG: hypothetical protein A2234_09605 [Elusimicrobia bacterium RIFOXYA2_FULL_58_8]
MNLKIFLFPVMALALAACGKEAAEPQKPPQEPVRTADAATRAGMSTGSSLGVVLNAPGNYVRGTVGNVDKAKTAARLANRTIDARMNIDPANPAGN